ncbi:MAG: rhamnan synthesis F family protein [Paracoccaceae bacterium]
MRVKLIPFWKIKRELKRLGRQLSQDFPDWLLDHYEYYRYTYLTSHKVNVTVGQREKSDKIVLFLVFPKNGIQNSHITMLEYFIKEGFSPLVVSNLPLSPEDLIRLSPFVWKTLQRENFGYDFGGYREGLLHIKNLLPTLNELVLTNDSIWFPVGNGSNWLESARKTGAQFVGPITAPGNWDRVEVYDYRDVSWKWNVNTRNYHLCSFMLWFNNDVTKSRKFLRFWKRLRITNRKRLTVRRGEMGLTRFMRSCGFSFASVIDLSEFNTVLAKLNALELKEIMEDVMAELHPKSLEVFAAHMSGFNDTVLWRDEAEKVLLALASKAHAAYFSPLLLLKHLDGNFLKKALVPRTKETADKVFQLLDNYPQYFDDAMAQEIRTTFETTHTD